MPQQAGVPTLDEFLEAARPLNPGFSDADHVREYVNAFGMPDDPGPLPTFEEFLPKAKALNPQASLAEHHQQWQGRYGVLGAKEKDEGDFMRGAKIAAQQIPQLAYGAAAGVAAAAETAFGSGGGLTALKEAAVKKSEEWGQKIAKEAKPSDSLSYSYDRAKEGDFGALVDWVQYGLGYTSTQVLEMLATGGLGHVVGKAGLQQVSRTLAEKMVEKETARLAATESLARVSAEQLTKQATANVAAKLGQNAALAVTATGMEAGEIFGDLTAQSIKEDRALTGAELARAFGTSLAAGALEFVGDRFGLDVITGKSPIRSIAPKATGLLGRAGRAAAGGTVTAGVEGLTEYSQTILEQVGKGQDPLSDPSIREQIDSAGLGAIGGAAVGGVSGAVQPVKPGIPALQAPKTMTPPPPPEEREIAAVLDQRTTLEESIESAQRIVESPAVADQLLKAALGREQAAAEPVLRGEQLPTQRQVELVPQPKPIPTAPHRIDESLLPTAQEAAQERLRRAEPEPTRPLPRTGQPTPVLEGAPAATAPSGIEVVSPPAPRVEPEPDAREQIARERQRLIEMRERARAARGEISGPVSGDLTDQETTALTPRIEETPLPSRMELAYPSVQQIHKLAEEKGIQWDQNPAFLEMTKMVTGQTHLDDLKPAQRQRLYDFINKLDTKTGLPEGIERPKEPLTPFEAATIPRQDLAPRQNAELLARAEKARADMEIAGGERGGMNLDYDVEGQGGTPGVTRWGSATADWYKEATTGERALSRARVEKAIAKIIADHGLDTGKDVQRIKQLLLEDREFEASPFMPQSEEEWADLVKIATEGRTIETPEVEGSPANAEIQNALDEASHEAATSPTNELPEPTRGQKEAGNYQKGHLRLAGLNISIENPAGSERSGTDRSGKLWTVTMKSHYGYIRGTQGKDKDHIDAFIKPGTPEDYSGPVFVVDQNEPSTSRFDEHKVIIGAETPEEAERLYLENYAKDWEGLRSIRQFTMPEFKLWLQMGNKQKPAASSSPSSGVSGEEAERLFDEAQALMRKLPNNIGKAKQEGRLSAKQLEALARLDEIEKIFPNTSPEWQRIYNLRRAESDAQHRQNIETFKAEQLARLREAGYEIGDEVQFFAASMLGPIGGGQMYRGKIIQTPNGSIRVRDTSGKTYAFFENPWKKAVASDVQTSKPVAPPKADQQEIPVPPPTIGQRPLIGREPTKEEAPLFSEQAKTPEPEQAELPTGEPSISPVKPLTQSEAAKLLLSGRDAQLPDTQKVQASIRLADFVERALTLGGAISQEELFEAADTEFGGTRAQGKYQEKDAYDALELGVNRYILGELRSVLPDEPMGTLTKSRQAVKLIRERIMDRIPVQRAVRTEEQLEYQQFSTPPDLAFAMTYAANVSAQDHVLEPSAGLGGLAAFSKMLGAKVTVNELSARREQLLARVGFDSRYRENAEQLNNVLPDRIKPTVILMNPPFSATAGRMEGERKSANVIPHLDQALKRLEPGGRLVALIGRSKAEFGGETSRKVEEWIKLTAQKYAFRARIGLSGEGYKKYGTTYDNQILVFDKIAPDGRQTVIANVQSPFEALTPLTEVHDARIPARTAQSETGGRGQPTADQPGGETLAPGGEGRPGVERPVSPATHPVGTRPEAATGGRRPAAPARPGGERTPWLPAREGHEATPADAGQREPGEQPIRGSSVVPAEPGGRSLAGRPSSGPDTHGARQSVPAEPSDTLSIGKADQPAPFDKADLSEDGIYEVYRPQKLNVPGAKDHPGELVQSSAMAAVNPPDVTYQPSIPKAIVDRGLLSIAQIEPIVAAGQSHQKILPNGQRRGYFIGDGTGVGKGREISGIILDNFNQGRTKALWVSKSGALITDAKRDWSGIDQDPADIFDLKGQKVSDAITAPRGILFTTYNTLIQGMKADRGGQLTKAKNKKTNETKDSRLDQIVDWLGNDFDGVIAFDEAHAMANATPSAGKRGPKDASTTGLIGLELQKRLPKARIVYVSATGATEVANLAYAERLGLWGEGTAFPDRDSFIGKMIEGGLAAMEVVAQNMKAMGSYISRQLSFRGVTYDRLEHRLTPAQIEIYNEMARAWQLVYRNITAALQETGGAKNGTAKGRAKGKFMSANQRFFNQVLTSMQMPSVIESVRRQIEDGHAVVLQLVNTNEAGLTREMEKAAEEGDTFEDVDLTPKEILMEYVRKAFPTQQFEEYIDENGKRQTRPVFDSQGRPVQNKEAVAMKEELLNRLGSLKVPDGALEFILDAFGEKQVAEVTGRQERLIRVTDAEGHVERVKQMGRTQKVRQADAKMFMDDKKRILVFSDAGGTGMSYHADRGATNQRKRIHYLVQPGWRADNAVQGFGRSHRTNQVQTPHYILVTTDLKGHKRFISSVARRLDQLGALTKGQRQTGTQGFFKEEDNLEGLYANAAVKSLMRDLYAGRVPGMGWQELVVEKMAFDNLVDKQDGKLIDERLPEVPQFLNRILSLEYEDQNAVFEEFNKRMRRSIEFAASRGELDVGLENYKADGVTLTKEQTLYTHPDTGAEAKLLTFETKHAVDFTPFESAKEMDKSIGFYKSQKTGKTFVAIKPGTTYTTEEGQIREDIILRGPIHGKSSYISTETLATSYDKLTLEQARRLWDETIKTTPPYRTEKLYLLSGVILPIWNRLPTGFVRILRVATDDGRRFLGRRIADAQLDTTKKRLGAESESRSYTPESALEALVAKGRGARIVLANLWTIKNVVLTGEERLELRGDDLYSARQELEKYGLFMERVQYDTRWFIPTDRAVEVLGNLTKYRPIMDVLGKSEGDAAGVAEAASPYGQPGQTGQQEIPVPPPTIGERPIIGREATPEEAPLFSQAVNEKEPEQGTLFEPLAPYRAEPVPTFFSQAERILTQKMPNRASGEQVRGILSPTNGAKPDELKWIGLDDYLKTKDYFTKQEVLDFVRANQVKVREVMLGGKQIDEDAFSRRHGREIEKLYDLGWLVTFDPGAEEGGYVRIGFMPVDENKEVIGDIVTEPEYVGTRTSEERVLALKLWNAVEQESQTATKFGQFQLPGGANYRELLLTLPVSIPAEITDPATLSNIRQGFHPRIMREREFISTHFPDVPNVLAHVRFNDRTSADGKLVLFIEEIQSDWAQKGRREGFSGANETRLNEAKKEYEALAIANVHRRLTEAERARLLELRPIVSGQGSTTRNVPSAPFVGSTEKWAGLALKRMLRYAAEHGYDSLAWTTGEQQAGRYDLSKQIDFLRVTKHTEGDYTVSAFRGHSEVIRRTEKPDMLPELVGKEMADRIVREMASEEEGTKEWRGLDLKVGGEGMKGFYDEIIPAYLNKYGKKWGAKVERIDLGTWPIRDAQGGVEMRQPDVPGAHAITITDAMRQSVLTEGQALFENVSRYAVREGEQQRLNFDLAQAVVGDLDRAGQALSSATGRVDLPVPGRTDVRTVGLGISPDLVHQGVVDLKGYRVASALDLAKLAQVYRDPRFETFRFIYVKGDTIVGHEGVTSRLPGKVKVFKNSQHRVATLADAKARMQVLGADGYWLLHNHPSGNSKPSQDDVHITGAIKDTLPGFRGHVVIDSNEYSTIMARDEPGMVDVNTHKAKFGKERLLRPSIEHPLLGNAIRSSADGYRLARSLQSPAGYLTVLYRGGQKGGVRAIQEISVEFFLGPNARTYLMDQLTAFGAHDAITYYPTTGRETPLVTELGNKAMTLIRDNVLIDHVVENVEQSRYASMADLGVKAQPGMWYGRREADVAMETVAERASPYQPGLNLETPEQEVIRAIRGTQQRLPLSHQPDRLAYQIPESTSMDDTIRLLQDKNIDLQRLVESIQQTGKQVADDLNPVLKEEMYMGRVSQRLKDFLVDELEPLVKAMRSAGVTMEQIDRYLHARHAREANAYLKSINEERPDNEALSGMTDQEADRILATADKKVMEPLAQRVDAILAKTRQSLVDYGLESQATINQWQKQYAHYVPLHREGFEDEPALGTGMGRSVRGPQAKRRLGSTRGVANILANVARDREKALVRGEKMRPVIALAGLLIENPNRSIAHLAKPTTITYTDPETGLEAHAISRVGDYQVPMIRFLNQRTGQVESRPDPTYKGRDNVVNFRLQGKDYAIIFNEENERAMHMARALKDLDVGQLNSIMQAVAPVTRYLASINTQYNPIFGIVNFIRDSQFAMLTLQSTPLAGKREEVRQNAWKALRGIYADARAIRRGEHATSETAQLWERFQETGGQTGYRDLFRTSNDRAKAIEHMLDPDWWQKTMGGKLLTAGGHLSQAESAILNKAAKPLFEWLSDYNLTMENAVRLGVFKTGIDAGLSDEKAASLAKNITVNFNKKGQISAQAGALYAFFNASVQGTARMAETLFEPGKFGVLRGVGKRILVGGVTLGVLQTFALTMAGFGDDEPPEWLKARSLVIPVPGTEKGYVSIPMPLGFNMIPSIGRLAAEAIVFGRPVERGYRFFGALIDAFSPVGSSASVLQMAAPTVVDPWVALVENKDWTGRQIAKEDFNKLQPTPGHARIIGTATPWARGIAEAINYATLGSAYSPGLLSPTPDQIDYLVSQATGGIGREVSKTASLVSGLATGEDVPLYKVPLVGRLVGTASDLAATREKFYRNVRELNTLEAEIKGRRQNREDVTSFLREHPEARMAEMAGLIEREVQALNRRKRDLIKRGANPEQIRLIEERIGERMRRLNQRVESLASK